MKIKNLHLLAVAFLATLLLSACADVSHVHACLQPNEHTYGFWGGTWHGMIMGISFIGSLFSDNIAIYAVNNNGAWYDFGYVGGFWVFLRIIGLIIKQIK